MNLYEQIKNWIQQYEPISSDWIYFNVVNFEAGFVSLNSVTTSKLVSKDVLGNRTIDLLVAVAMIKEYDNGTSNNNLDAIQEVDNFASWVENQVEYPDFGAGKTVEKIEISDNGYTPAIDADNNLAKYEFTIRFRYKEESEGI